MHQSFQTVSIFRKHWNELKIKVPQISIICYSDQQEYPKLKVCSRRIYLCWNDVWVVSIGVLFFISVVCLYETWLSTEYLPGCVQSSRGSSIPENIFLQISYTQSSLKSHKLDSDTIHSQLHVAMECSALAQDAGYVHKEDQKYMGHILEEFSSLKNAFLAIPQCNHTLESDYYCEKLVDAYIDTADHYSKTYSRYIYSDRIKSANKPRPDSTFLSKFASSDICMKTLKP